MFRSIPYENLLKMLLVVLSITYPVVVYFGLQTEDMRYIIIVLVAVVIIRAITLDKSPLNHWSWLLLLLAFITIAWLSSSAIVLKLYPVLISASFFLLFSWSLWNPPPIIERLARLTYTDFPDRAICYTRRVTIVWCYFFVINGTVALGLSLYASDALWVLYNGFISYILMGLLFSIEWIIRQRVMKKYHD